MKYLSYSALALCVGFAGACDPKPDRPMDPTPTAAEAPHEGLEQSLKDEEEVEQAHPSAHDKTDTHGTDSVGEAEAELQVAEGQELEGEVEFEQRGNTVVITAEIEDAAPGKHGFHIHEKGDCSDIPGKSMGGHLNPENHEHRLPSEEGKRHLGDLGNIEVGADGKADLRFELDGATLKADDPKSLLGKAVVIHSGEDSGQAKQPAGAAGTPIACGVIERDS